MEMQKGLQGNQRETVVISIDTIRQSGDVVRSHSCSALDKATRNYLNEVLCTFYFLLLPPSYFAHTAPKVVKYSGSRRTNKIRMGRRTWLLVFFCFFNFETPLFPQKCNPSKQAAETRGSISTRVSMCLKVSLWFSVASLQPSPIKPLTI